MNSPIVGKLRSLVGHVEGAAQVAAPDDLTRFYNMFIRDVDIVAALPKQDLDQGLGFVSKDLSVARNTFYSIYTGAIDEEITLGVAKRKLRDLSLEISKIYQISAEVVSGNLEFVKPVEKQKQVEIEGATRVTPKQKLGSFQDLEKVKEKILTEEERARQNLEKLGKTEEQHKDTPTLNQLETEKRDQIQHDIFKKYQEGINGVRSAHVQSGEDWTLTKGPVYFSSYPILSDFQIKQLHVPFSGTGFLPRPDHHKSSGWILDRQLLIGITFSPKKEPNKFMDTLEYAMKVLESRFGKLAIMTPALVTGKKIRKVGDIKMEDVHSIPRVIALPGKNLNFVWVMPAQKYNSLPPIKINQVGFPIAPNLRDLGERRSGPAEKSSLHQELVNMKPRSEEFQRRVAEETSDIDAAIDEIKNQRAGIAQKLKSYDGLLAVEQDKPEPDEIEIARLHGEMRGYRELLSRTNQKLKSLQEQKDAKFRALSQEERNRLRLKE